MVFTNKNGGGGHFEPPLIITKVCKPPIITKVKDNKDILNWNLQCIPNVFFSISEKSQFLVQNVPIFTNFRVLNEILVQFILCNFISRKGILTAKKIRLQLLNLHFWHRSKQMQLNQLRARTIEKSITILEG